MENDPNNPSFEHLFRHQAGQIVASLTRILGWQHVALAEDVVQDTLLKAMRHWPVRGVPDNPKAWLLVTARNRAIDLLRRESNLADKVDEIGRWVDTSDRDKGEVTFARELDDDQLRMIFACSTPALSQDSQVALTLKILCGLSVDEIARAFFAKPATIAQRIVRAQRTLREADKAIAVPEPSELPSRLRAVYDVIYLLFNEGYSAYEGENLVRYELIEEAIRLGELLAANPVGDLPETHALLALMYLQASRLPSRVDADSNLVLLRDQDRTRWDRHLISRGMAHLEQSAHGDEMTAYHLEAGIAAEHAMARSYDQTNWGRIRQYYDELVRRNPSAVLLLNRAVAVAECDGVEAGLAEIQQLAELPVMKRYYLYHATAGEFHTRAGHTDLARDHFRRAAELATCEPERRFLQGRVAALES
jgi:RNA polymerase sigma factor (sigma-70 family)